MTELFRRKALQFLALLPFVSSCFITTLLYNINGFSVNIHIYLVVSKEFKIFHTYLAQLD